MNENKVETVSSKIMIQTLFGEAEVGVDFKLLDPLGECDEEILEPLVDGLLYKKTYALMSGDKASLKSWLAAYISVCIALGKPCFELSVVRGKVVYVYGEGNMKKRLKRICKALGDENPRDLYPFPLRDDLSTKEGQENLKKHIPPGTVLVVIDNYEKYWGSDVNEEEVNEATVLLRELREYATVLLVQHNVKHPSKKANQFQRSRGHTRLVNNADSTIALTKHGDIVTCEIYVREKEALDPFQFKLVDNLDSSIICEKVVGLDPIVVFSYAECFKAVLVTLQKEFKEAKNKTSIYEDHLKGKAIKGFSAKIFYSKIFGQLVDEGWLEEEKDRKGYYHSSTKLLTSDFLLHKS